MSPKQVFTFVCLSPLLVAMLAPQALLLAGWLALGGRGVVVPW